MNLHNRYKPPDKSGVFQPFLVCGLRKLGGATDQPHRVKIQVGSGRGNQCMRSRKYPRDATHRLTIPGPDRNILKYPDRTRLGLGQRFEGDSGITIRKRPDAPYRLSSSPGTRLQEVCVGLSPSRTILILSSPGVAGTHSNVRHAGFPHFETQCLRLKGGM